MFRDSEAILVLFIYIYLVTLISTRELKPNINYDFKRYHGFDEIETYLKEVARKYPEFVQLKYIGWSHQKRHLVGLKIGFPAGKKSKRNIWIDGGNHAREWPAFHTATYIINELVTNYGVDPTVTEYVNKLTIYIFPVLNPDGFEFSRSSDVALIRHWRKNRAPENCTGSIVFRKNLCCEGVDLNRNYDFNFKQNNYPFNNSCSDEYQGPYPFSEPETRAVRDFIRSQEMSTLDALVSMHTHGQLIILPYNHRKKTYPKDYFDMLNVAQKMKRAIQLSNGREYRVGTAADILVWFSFQVKPLWLVPIAEET